MTKNDLINIKVKENLIGVMRVGNVEYISLTDIAKYKNADTPNDVVKKWMSNKNSFDFYSLWEELFNSNFNFEMLKCGTRFSFELKMKKYI